MLRIGEEDFLELGHLYNEFRIGRLNAGCALRSGIILCCATANISVLFFNDVDVSVLDNFKISFSLF